MSFRYKNMQNSRSLLLILLVLFSRSGSALVWESLAGATQMFSASCPANAPAPAEPSADSRTEATVVGDCPDCEVRTGPVSSLVRSSEVISDSTYLAALAEERSLNHGCAIPQLDKALGSESEFYSKDVQAKVEALNQAILTNIRTSEENSRIPKRQIAAQRERIAKTYQEQSAAIAALQNSIPFSTHPIMAKFISQTVQESLRESTTLGALGGKTPVPPKALGPEFTAGLNKALTEVRASLKEDKAKLDQGVKSSGTTLDRATRESLAQDRDLIESYVQRNPSLKESLKGPACRVDRTYGKGAEDRDTAIFVGSIGLTAVSGGLALASRGVSLLTLTSGVRMASARGLLTANSARILGGLAVHTGRSALALGTVGGFRETASACLNSQQIVPKAAGANAPRCENYSVKGVVADNCYLAAGLTALGTVASIPGTQRLLQKLAIKAGAPILDGVELAGSAERIAPGSSVLVPRSAGGFTPATVATVDGKRALVTWEAVDNLGQPAIARKWVSLDELSGVGSRVTIPRSDGSTSQGEITARLNDGRVRVDFKTDTGEPAFKIVDPSTLRPAASAPEAVPQSYTFRSRRVSDYSTRGGQKIVVDHSSPYLQAKMSEAMADFKAAGIRPVNPGQKPTPGELERVSNEWLKYSAKIESKASGESYDAVRNQMIRQNNGVGDVGQIAACEAAVCRELSIFGSVAYSELGYTTRVVKGNVSKVIDGQMQGGGHAWIEILDPTTNEVVGVVDNNFTRKFYSNWQDYYREVNAVPIDATVVASPR